DPRLDAWDAAWFAGRTVLDVGCNAGLVAVEVAARFAPRAVLGVDIDPGLVRKAGGVLAARYSLTKPAIAWDAGKGCIVKLEGTADGAPYFPLSAIAAHGTVPIIRPEKVPVIGADGEEERLEGFPWNVEFAVGDWTKAPARKEGSWDVVLALAITKWIHLNGGDAGLRKFLAKLAAVLAPGGRLIIEAQPWASYLKRTKEWDLSKLEMRPEGTRGELEGLGLAWERTVSAPAADDEAEAGGKARKTAFSDREMMVFVKP
ncbi:S-adenosyl-L-methionine-dependent methyltransferase, partial [Hyaloraphidium curvatum]